MRAVALFLLIVASPVLFAQQGRWGAKIHRGDGNNITFTFEWKTEKKYDIRKTSSSFIKSNLPSIQIIKPADNFYQL